jgi:hypothetical protein
MYNAYTQYEDDIIRTHYPKTCKDSIISMLYGHSWGAIKQRAKRLGIRREVAYKMPVGTNHHFFDEWSDTMAYVLGFIAADGNIRDGNYLRIRLSEKDAGFLSKLGTLLAPAKAIRHAETKQVYDNTLRTYKTAELCIGSQYMCSKLNDLGLRERKTWNLSFSPMPSQHLRHFIRGYFDGDGCMSTCNPAGHQLALRMTIVGTKSFLEEMNNIVSSALAISVKSVRKCDTEVYQTAYATEDSIKFARWIYADNTICLERKYNKFVEFCNERKNTTIRTMST